jgi:hypothetical protein
METVLSLSRRSFRPFAHAHGYDFVEGVGDADGRPPAWGKVLLLRRLLESYEEVLWLDSDTIVLDPSVDLAEAVPSDAWQAIARNESRFGVVPNSGVWFLRSCGKSKAFLDAVWASDAFINHRIWENKAVCELLGYTTDPYQKVRESEWDDGTAWLGEEWNQVYGISGLAQARIRHYAGCSNAFRVARMRADLLPRRAGYIYWVTYHWPRVAKRRLSDATDGIRRHVLR